MQIQWGSVGEWVSGVGSLAAVFTAIGLSVRAERQMRLYRTEDEARLRTVRAQDEATRAREIAAQLTIKDNGGSSDGEQHYRWSALVTNRAPQGFTNVHVGALVNGVSHTAPGPDAVAQGEVDMPFSVSVLRTQGDPPPQEWTIEYEATGIGRWSHNDKGRLQRLDH